MLIRMLGLAACLVAAAPAVAADAAGTNAAVLAPLHAFFDGMAKSDQVAMRAVVQPEGSVALLRKDKLVRMSLGDFVDHIKPGKDAIEERIHDPVVEVDDNLAMIWTPYEFLVNGQVKHCGTDLVHLVKLDGRWVIAGIADNSRDACPKG
ncbi:nuclear transport factor 2 family protein [Bacillus sp. NP157]|nr:nuclear transport factor 2 family protein [Bacillus sp. NP157]